MSVYGYVLEDQQDWATTVSSDFAWLKCFFALRIR
jgi:hypothetical protein